ncbi:hypothetical protein QJQ45_023833 [Haematococcus lacustris]|nr:hypothetical protein QJQ45_023833 [Haematococcus lacustris]
MDCSAPVIWWCRRDLRVDDNPSLLAALQSSPNLVGVALLLVPLAELFEPMMPSFMQIPLFIWAPEEEGQFQPGRFSRWWTKQSVALFQRLLGRLGSRLIIRRCSDTAQCITQVVAETGAKAVYFNHLYDPISLVRDHEVKTALTKLGVECRSFNSDLLYEPWELLDSAGEPFTSFEAFWNRTLAMPYPPPFPLPAPHQLPPVSLNIDSTPLEKVDWFQTPEQEASCDQLRFKWKPGVEGAVEKLESFLTNRLTSFEADRAKVDRDSTSQLSPWIHIGTISVRYIFYRVCQQQAEWAAAASSPLVPPQALPSITNSCKDFLQQMGYREYSRYLSFHFPFITERALLAHLRACPWRLDQAAFKAWRQGQTGYPLVDAAMRQLSSTGWCHNRMRVVAASFMVKNLLLPWQWGLKHYWDAQLDADLECDALGWQYVSGGMADAHPFDHIIDLEKEAQRFDADGEYVRRWLPVLSRMPTQHIHAPWRAPHAVLAAADVELGFDYPERVVTAEESARNMAEACHVLQHCQATGSSDRRSGPYRTATLDLALAVAAGVARGSSGAGTGTGFVLCGEQGSAGNKGSNEQDMAGSGPALLQEAPPLVIASLQQRRGSAGPGQHQLLGARSGMVGTGAGAGAGTGPKAEQAVHDATIKAADVVAGDRWLGGPPQPAYPGTDFRAQGMQGKDGREGRGEGQGHGAWRRRMGRTCQQHSTPFCQPMASEGASRHAAPAHVGVPAGRHHHQHRHQRQAQGQEEGGGQKEQDCGRPGRSGLADFARELLVMEPAGAPGQPGVQPTPASWQEGRHEGGAFNSGYISTSSGCSEDMEAMSEEVVSNTIGLSRTQTSGWSCPRPQPPVPFPQTAAPGRPAAARAAAMAAEGPSASTPPGSGPGSGRGPSGTVAAAASSVADNDGHGAVSAAPANPDWQWCTPVWSAAAPESEDRMRPSCTYCSVIHNQDSKTDGTPNGCYNESGVAGSGPTQAPTGPTQQPRGHTGRSLRQVPALPPAKRTKAEQAAEPTQPSEGKGKAAKAKPAPQPGRWLDRDKLCGSQV